MTAAEPKPTLDAHAGQGKARSPDASWVTRVLVALGVALMCGGALGLFGYKLLLARRENVVAAAHKQAERARGESGRATPPAPLTAQSSAAGTDSKKSGVNPSTVPHEALRQPGAEPRVFESVAGSAALGLHAEDALAPLPLDALLPMTGAQNPLVTLTVFGDLQCVHTRRSLPVLLRLVKTFDDLRLVWRNRPMPDHEFSERAAELLAIVHRTRGNSLFWDVIEQSTKTEAAPSEDEISRWFEHAGASNWGELRAELGPGSVERIARDVELAARYEVRSTPTFFVNGLRLEGEKSFSELKQVIEHERKAALATLLSGVRRSDLYLVRTKKNLINVGPEIVDRTCPKIAGSPARGARDALVTVVEFSDFECEYCKRAQPIVSTLLARHPAELRLVWKNFPLEQHENAGAAAALAMSAFELRGQRTFWEAHDALFKLAPELDEPALLAVAESVGLKGDVARDALRRADHAQSVVRDVALAEKLGVSGTPTFFVNGRKLDGVRLLADFERIIEQEVETARRLLAGGLARDKLYDAVCGSS